MSSAVSSVPCEGSSIPATELAPLLKSVGETMVMVQRENAELSNKYRKIKAKAMRSSMYVKKQSGAGDGLAATLERGPDGFGIWIIIIGADS